MLTRIFIIMLFIFSSTAYADLEIKNDTNEWIAFKLVPPMGPRQCAGSTMIGKKSTDTVISGKSIEDLCEGSMNLCTLEVFSTNSEENAVVCNNIQQIAAFSIGMSDVKNGSDIVQMRRNFPLYEVTGVGNTLRIQKKSN